MPKNNFLSSIDDSFTDSINWEIKKSSNVSLDTSCKSCLTGFHLPKNDNVEISCILDLKPFHHPETDLSLDNNLIDNNLIGKSDEKKVIEILEQMFLSNTKQS